MPRFSMDSSVKNLKAGLIGSGIQASLTPAMHMVEGAAQGFQYDYELIDFAQLDKISANLSKSIAEAEARGFCGLNITHPFKQLVIPYLDDLSKEARALGAVNTIVLKDGKRFGHNTDCWGFSQSFKRGLPDVDLSAAVQIGAGGAGAATAYAILSLGLKRLAIFDLEAERAEQLAASMGALFPEAEVVAVNDIGTAMRDAAGLIHATPMGMAKYPGMPLSPELLNEHHWVAEIVYFPLRTQLLIEADKRGCRILNGGGMAVFQAVGAFKLFTGHEPDVDRMLKHFESMASRP